MKYRSEDDKCYGVAGMAIGLSIFDASELYSGISLDGDGLDCITFTPQFYFAGNPRLNAKESWQCLHAHYQVGLGLTIANVVCRKMLHDHGTVDRKMRNQLLKAATQEGKELCQLEPDEVREIFDRYLEHMVRVFGNSDIGNATRQLVEQIKRQRSLTSAELGDLLRDLEIIEYPPCSTPYPAECHESSSDQP